MSKECEHCKVPDGLEMYAYQDKDGNPVVVVACEDCWVIAYEKGGG